MSDVPEEDLLSLQHQLGNARENLRLIQERKTEFVLSTDISLQLVKEERRWLAEIAELKQRMARVASGSPKAERRPAREAADQHIDIERPTADDRNQETALQNYLDKMTELLLEKHLSDPEASPAVLHIARARTVTTLHQLDSTRRDLLLGFLRQAGLISKRDPVQLLTEADLGRADLSGAILYDANLMRAMLSEANLSDAILFEADLSEAYLRDADLSGAILHDANLTKANLMRAILSEAYLDEANLGEADLSGADLSMADLSGADLSMANLSEANLSQADLRGADLSRADLNGANLSGTRYDDATQWPEGFTPPSEAVKVEGESAPPSAEVKEGEL